MRDVDGDAEWAIDAAMAERAVLADRKRPARTPADITLTYSTIDHFRETRKFKTVEGARAYAARRIGKPYDISETFGYAIDAYGVGKLEARGISLAVLLS